MPSLNKSKLSFVNRASKKKKKTVTYIVSSLLTLVSDGVLTCFGVAIGVELPPTSCLLETKNDEFS